jgi:tape measure domain-containing protein
VEVARLESIYTANVSDFEKKSAQVDSRFKQTAQHSAQTEKAVANAFRNPPPGLSQSISGVSSSLLSLKSIAAGVFAGFTLSAVISELKQAGSAVLEFSSNLETSKIAFTTMLGSADLAAAHLKELQHFALTTPFEFSGLVDASKRMQAMGFEARQVVPILTDVGNAVAAVGGSSLTLDRVILAISQIQAKGRVAAQEMNQLAEAGIPAWRILSEELGKSRAETIKLAEDGKISGKVFLDAFQKFSQTNFGGMMEKQSHTFMGAMSNLKDILLQTSATAFEPLFKKISEVTDRISMALQEGKPGLEAALTSVVQGLIEVLGSAGAQAGTSFIESTARKIRDPEAWKQLLSNVTGATFLDPLLRGLFSVDPEDLFGLGDPLGDITRQVQIPDLRAPLPKLTNDQKQTSDAVRKAGEIYQDVALRVAFYGQNTEKAATQQRLLAIGLEALTSAEGRRAVQLAELIDKQRISAELNESQKKLTDDLAAITENKYKNAFDSLLQVQGDAVIQTLELNAAERDGLTALERFNFGLGAQIEGMLSMAQASGFSAEQIQILTNGLVNARTAMIGLTEAQEQNKRRLEIKRLGEQRTELLRSLAGINVDLTRGLRRTPSDEIQQLAQQLEGLSSLKIIPGGLDLFVEKLRAGSLDAQTAIVEIRTAISGAAGDLGSEFDGVAQRIANLFLKAQELSALFAHDEATARYRDTLASLLDVIQGDVRLTNAQRVEKLLLTEAYKNLTEAQIESLRAIAEEADITERLREREHERLQSMREVAEDLGSIFSDVFDSIQGDWSNMWRDMARIAQNISRQFIQELFTGLFSRAFNVPFTSRAGGIVGTLTNAIFQRPASGTGSSGGVGAAAGAVIAGARAFGGPVEAGLLYRINERGEEYFKPSIGGQIIPIGPSSQNQALSRLFLVDDERAAFERGATRREMAKVSRQMRKIGKLVNV